MNTKKIILSVVCLVLSFLLTACKDDADNLLTADTQMTVDILLRHTPVKDQGKTEACWIYAYLACIETERIEQFGDSLNLSPLWLIRANLMEQAEQRYLCQGRRKITSRGIGPEAEYLLYKYGMVPYGNYSVSQGINTRVVERSLSVKVDIAVRAKKGISALNDDIEGDLPTLSHGLERGFYLYSMNYTPLQFGESLTNGADYEWYSSYTHHPFGEPFDIELSDNRRHMLVNNIPVDSLLAMTIHAIEHHHAVFWEGTMPGKRSKKSGEPIAMRVNPADKTAAKDRSTTAFVSPLLTPDAVKMIQKSRQQAFETFETYDQHAMAIIGLAHDTIGRRYLICKNSWGKKWGNKGLCYMSIEDFIINTILIGVPL